MPFMPLVPPHFTSIMNLRLHNTIFIILFIKYTVINENWKDGIQIFGFYIKERYHIKVSLKHVLYQFSFSFRVQHLLLLMPHDVVIIT